jgi:hypothetical protein
VSTSGAWFGEVLYTGEVKPVYNLTAGSVTRETL